MVNFGGVSGEQLRMLVSKIEKLEEEKKEISECIKDAFAEAKSQGFDIKVLRQLLKIRKMDQSELAEQEEILDIYKHALGMSKNSAEYENSQDSESQDAKPEDKEAA